MKIQKSVLLEAVKVLGKVVAQTSPEEVARSVRLVGAGKLLRLMATDGAEWVVVSTDNENEDAFDFTMEYRALREAIRSTRGEEVELSGKQLEWPERDYVPGKAVSVELPAGFWELLALAAPIVDRNASRHILRGINLSQDGVTVTNGKELLHLPCPLTIPEELTLPFPLALLAAKPTTSGLLHIWRGKNNERLFQIDVGGIQWQGGAMPGLFPAWKQVIPTEQNLDYAIELAEPERIIAFLKTVPDHGPLHGIELDVTPEGVAIVPVDTPKMRFQAKAEVKGGCPKAVLALNKYILLRMLQQGYTRLRAHSEGRMPVMAEGGAGCYIAMPIHLAPKANPQTSPQPNPQTKLQPNPTNQEEAKMETNETREPRESDFRKEGVSEAPDPMEELNHGLDELRGKLKLLLDETGVLTRKIKEAALKQKQKERDFILAKRAIERIRMAI